MKVPSNVPASIITRNLSDFTAETGNVYESIAIISKRANQISVKIKEELNGKLAEFATTVDNLEEVFENREQIEISKHYERMPKSTNLAIEEFMEGKVTFHRPTEEELPTADKAAE
ncbi:DNA-directed RNA polymerase subunit omega [Hymenobacter busanensis]|uniref:DNA-directed RNA polymerase subunit omega n=1 Tax=Hymenobacter busanensis TaxID=2607656 RepID=A0A7L4ZYP8_9BACT|nr:DNA-directed RNA polymerase subunit omega [Hymenobacter busanensis]KAA9332311.1 DNA-directed RNA polymerase subunit omega [Hymenobacter busanensis]QHJ07352.1 DNA-directed RNA polymerase subunit omega [Hymenobacter busanensis]